MKLQEPINANYAATVVSLSSIKELENCDNIVATPIHGYQAIVGRDQNVGDIGIVFPAETQLSVEFCHHNNLYRDFTMNNDSSAKGYFEKNRRVRAVKLRGHRSDCLFMPLSSLNYLGFDFSDLQAGDTFDQLGGQFICNKYVVPIKGSPRTEKNKAKVQRVDKKFFPEHYDTDNYFRNESAISEDSWVVVTQKLHGTSIRIGNTVINRKLTWLEKIAKKFGVNVNETEFAHVYGSRKVVKDVNNPNQDHFYEVDIWSTEGRKLDDIVLQNYIIYGELIGWTPGGAPIQTGYTYNVPSGQCRLYVYRVAFVNSQGRMVDLSWNQVKEFCNDFGLNHVPELWQGFKRDLVIENYLDVRFCDSYVGVVPCGAKVDEGVCVRLDGLAPYILKAKSPEFLVHETNLLDKGVADLDA